MTAVSLFIVSSAVFALFYFMVIILVLTGLLKKKPVYRPGSVFNTKVTVIIPARNEESGIGRCLEDMRSQDFPRELMEVVLVDDGSSDRTYELAEKFAKENTLFPLIILRRPENECSGSKKAAVSYAVANSSGMLILATDADTRRGNKWIAGFVSYYETFRPAMILGPVAFSRGRGLFSELQSCEFTGLMSVTDGSCSLHRPLMCNGANIAYTRQAFEEVKGFEGNANIASGDDMFLLMKILKQYGSRAVHFLRSREIVVETDPAKDLESFVRQRLRWVSKNRNVKDPAILCVAVITYLFNFSLFAGLISGFFFPAIWICTLLLFAGKLIIEFPVIWKYSSFLGNRQTLWVFPLAQLLNIFYVTIIGLLGNFLAFEWKGKVVTPSGKGLQ